MKISIVNGFFLPVPPVSGGATEKSWYFLAKEFAAAGHEVTMISRRWRSFPSDETSEGIRHLRLKGYSHTRHLWQNLLLDFIWSWRVFRALPPADVAVINCVALPIWLGRLKPAAGKVAIMTGRIPKGQYRHYRNIARVLAASTHVLDLVKAENPSLEPVSRVCGYPINWRLLNADTPTRHPFIPSAPKGEVTIGFVGRIHEEKGLSLLADALSVLANKEDLPRWRVLLCGPIDVARGGSGPEYRTRLLQQLGRAVHPERIHLIEPEFNERALAGLYRQIDIFCLPSISEKGETFGVAAAEAMAAGCATVVSGLACFRDFVRDSETGLVFDHTAPDAVERLSRCLSGLLLNESLRFSLAARGREATRRYDYAQFASDLLDDFAQLARG